MARVIARGDIWIVDLNPGSYREIHKKRPCLIISGSEVNEETNSTIIIPTSSQVPKVLGIDKIAVGKKEGFTKASVLLPLFIRSIDQDRLVKKIGAVSEEILIYVEEVIKLILAIS